MTRRPIWATARGQQIVQPSSLQEAFQQLPAPVLQKEALYFQDGTLSPYSAVTSYLPNQNRRDILGAVSQYEVLPLEEFAQMWDSTGKKIETLTISKRFVVVSSIFRQYSLGDGDQITDYFLAIVPLTPYYAIELHLTPLRVACQNALTLAKALGTRLFRVTHSRQFRSALREWFEQSWAALSQSASTSVESTFNLFNEVPSHSEVKETVKKLLPPRYQPQFDTLLSQYPETLWGVWNAFVEVEDHVIHSRGSLSGLLGERRDRKVAVFNLLGNYLQGKRISSPVYSPN